MRNWLIDLRMKNHLSRTECAKRAGISRVYLYQIEKGEKNPSWEIALKLSNVLRFDMRKFYESTGENLQLLKTNNRA